MYMIEETAAATALDTTGDGVDNGMVGQSMEEAIGGLFPNTPAPDRPSPAPQAHRARITGVTIENNKDQTAQWLKVSYTSLDNGQDDSLTVFLPQAYIDNPSVDPATLSTAPGAVGANGKAAPRSEEHTSE